jgi:hypothetical protein
MAVCSWQSTVHGKGEAKRRDAECAEGVRRGPSSRAREVLGERVEVVLPASKERSVGAKGNDD